MLRALTLLALSALPATAQVSAEGHFYETTCNASGYVLTSDYPVGRFFGTGAGTTVTTGREVLYLGTSCDAARDGWGAGTWCWANGGFVVTFPEDRIGFPRGELHCPDTGAASIDLLTLDCGC